MGHPPLNPPVAGCCVASASLGGLAKRPRSLNQLPIAGSDVVLEFGIGQDTRVDYSQCQPLVE
jgi:hypothetical protein